MGSDASAAQESFDGCSAQSQLSECSSMHAGQDQPELAAAAMKAIFIEKQKSHRVTLCTPNSEGASQWTQYEMWPVSNHVPGFTAPAMLVSTLNVTHQCELELQLEAAKEQLQR